MTGNFKCKLIIAVWFVILFFLVIILEVCCIILINLVFVWLIIKIFFGLKFWIFIVLWVIWVWLLMEFWLILIFWFKIVVIILILIKFVEFGIFCKVFAVIMIKFLLINKFFFWVILIVDWKVWFAEGKFNINSGFIFYISCNCCVIFIWGVIVKIGVLGWNLDIFCVVVFVLVRFIIVAVFNFCVIWLIVWLIELGIEFFVFFVFVML